MKTLQERDLIRQAEAKDDYQVALTELKKINPTYHFCLEWDGAVICDKDIEFEACLCYSNKSQSSVLSKEGEELKPMPDKDGWNFDYNILCDIEHVCTAKDEFVSLEAIDAILLSLHELGFTITRKTNPPKV